MPDGLKTWLKPLTKRLIAAGSLLARPMTLGVRVAVFDGEGRVFLVRHTYLPGWYLPGGGVDPGETMAQAAARELREEGNIVLTEAPILFGIYLNSLHSKRNHVALYVARGWRQDTAPQPAGLEIAEAGFFAADNPPPETTPATRRRLAEIAGAEVPPDYW